MVVLITNQPLCYKVQQVTPWVPASVEILDCIVNIQLLKEVCKNAVDKTMVHYIFSPWATVGE